ncbi:MAG: CPBP family intramembrane metalloprotease [Gemmataceae bacterium]|nr:CPBP family intramembrane metalloprotease [Gemmataceae bacterium]
MPPHDPPPNPIPPPDGWDIPEAEPADAAAPAVPVIAPLPWCRRCGETIPEGEPGAGRCPWCGSALGGPTKPRHPPRATPVLRPARDEDDFDDRPRRSSRRERDEPEFAIPVRRPHLIPPLVIVILAYVMLIGALIFCGMVAAFRGATSGDDLLRAQALTEVVSTVLTLGALGLVWSSARQPAPENTRALTWAVSLPVLALMLCANLLFFTILRELLRPAGATEPERMQLTLFTILLICVQPAIVEELFFRQMTLGVMRGLMNTHVAVWVTGAVFALAHLSNPLGMPYLFVVGGLLGYARVYGGLSLAMILHFLHNLVVVSYDALR